MKYIPVVPRNSSITKYTNKYSIIICPNCFGYKKVNVIGMGDTEFMCETCRGEGLVEQIINLQHFHPL